MATAAIASLALALTLQQQNVAAFNDKNQFVFNTHNHLKIGAKGIQNNNVNTRNDATYHYNDNFNQNRAETFRSNCHLKPATTSGQCSPSS